MALSSMIKWDLHQMDVKETFMNGMIVEYVYIKQPQGFEVEDRWFMYVSWKMICME